jgi:hypothetical protein
VGFVLAERAQAGVTFHASADSLFSVFEVPARERSQSRRKLIRVPAHAKVLVVTALPSNCCVGCQPRAVNLGLLQRRTTSHFLGLSYQLLHTLGAAREWVHAEVFEGLAAP